MGSKVAEIALTRSVGLALLVSFLVLDACGGNGNDISGGGGAAGSGGVAGGGGVPGSGGVAGSGVAGSGGVAGSDVPTAIAAGNRRSCALTSAGRVLCWGSLGDSGVVPAAVSGLSSGVTQISVPHSSVNTGGGYTCALTSDGVQCWVYSPSFAVEPVSGLGSGVTQISSGYLHACALTNGGGVQCWGSNPDGELGDGTHTTSLVPVAASGLSSGITQLSVGNEHTCALSSSGGVLCWGRSDHCELGISVPSVVPVAIPEDNLKSGIVQITSGGAHTCALTSGGGVLCWGDNYSGQLGNGDGNDSCSPVTVTGLSSGVTQISAGGSHTCALTSNGGVLCWGENSDGQLGNNGTIANSLVPVAVSGLSSGVAQISAGGSHACALTTGGEVLCWGDDAYGQLGDGSFTDSPVPVPVVF